MSIEVTKENGDTSVVNIGMLGNSNKAVNDLLEEGEENPFTYTDHTLKVLANLSGSNIYYNPESNVSDEYNLEVLTEMLGEFTGDVASDSEMLVVKTFVSKGVVEYLITSNLEERVTVYVLCKIGVPPSVIGKYVNGNISYETIMGNTNEETIIAAEEAIIKLVALGRDEEGNDISILIERPKTETPVSPEIETMEEVTANVTEVIDKAVNTATSETESVADLYNKAAEEKSVVYSGGGSGSSDISTTTAVGIGLGVVALGAVAYFGYNCFFGDGCEDDITLME